jgi:hypothetical protein
MSKTNLIFQVILQEIAKNPPPVEVDDKQIEEIYRILEKNQFRINRSNSRDKITRIVNRIIKE